MHKVKCCMCGKDLLRNSNRAYQKCQKCKREYTFRVGSLARLNSVSHSRGLNYYAKKVYFAYGGKCAICGWRIDDKLSFPNGGYGNQIHHIVPVKKGGDDSFSNLIPLCPNHHKQADFGIVSIETIRRHQIKESDLDGWGYILGFAFRKTGIIARVRRVRWVFEREPVLFKLKEKKGMDLELNFISLNNFKNLKNG